MTTELTAAGTWFHVSGESETSASQWVEGSPRKGLYTGKRNMSLIVFDRTQLAEAVSGKTVTGAELLLTRDISYGSSMVTLTMAPANREAPPTGYKNRKQCLELADLTRHHLANTEGQAVAIPIAGATVQLLQEGEGNAFILYHSEDEEADAYIKFTGDVKLKLYLSDGTGDWRMPVWTRNINAGTIISDETHSHVRDLQEILWAINVRHMIKRLDKTDPYVPHAIDPSLTVGLYSDWAGVIEDLQDAAADMLEDEGRQAGSIEWTTLTAGMMPNAAIIEELRHAVSGEGEEQILAATDTVKYTINGQSTEPEMDETEAVTWLAGYDFEVGRWSVSTRPAAGVTVTLHYLGMGGWLFGDQISTSIGSAKLRLTVKAAKRAQDGKVHIILYGIKISQAPDQAASYDSIFDSTVIGEADCVVGEASEIELTAQGVQMLNNGDIHGAGVGYGNDECTLSKSASLLLNGAEAEAEEEEEEET